jgi:hypothetical protein
MPEDNTLPDPNAQAPQTNTPATQPPNTVNVEDVMGDMVNNPTLPAAGVVKPIAQEVKPDELLKNSPTMQGTQAATSQAEAVMAEAGQAGPAAQVTSNTAEQQKQDALNNATYDATKVDENAVDITGVHGTVTAKDTTKGQLDGLMQDFQGGQTPTWAAGAIRTANDAMAARGMGASSLAGAAVSQAIMEAAIPIAQSDAAANLQMNLTNLSNDQQALITKTTLNHQSMLSNQAMENAAKQFNAQNKTQVAQFFAGLIADIDKFNVSQQNAMEQFNAGERTKVNVSNASNATSAAVSNAQMANAQSQFNATARDNAEKFNIGNQLLIDQSNATWRRSINTANTLADNNANQLNALNALNISNTAMNNLWMASRDAANWAHTSSESAKDKAHNIAIAMLNRDTQFDLLDNEQSGEFWTAIGSFALSVLGDAMKD